VLGVGKREERGRGGPVRITRLDPRVGTREGRGEGATRATALGWIVIGRGFNPLPCVSPPPQHRRHAYDMLTSTSVRASRDETLGCAEVAGWLLLRRRARRVAWPFAPRDARVHRHPKIQSLVMR